MSTAVVRERARDLNQNRQEELEQTLEKIKHRHGSADGAVDVAQLPPEVADVHASVTAELSAIEANRLVKIGSQLYTHATTGGGCAACFVSLSSPSSVPPPLRSH